MELRRTDTNAADDSRGRAFGLEGDLYLPVVAALLGSLGLFALFGLGFGVGWPLAAGLAAGPLALTLAWAFGLRHGRPPGYDRDWMEQRLGSGDFWRQQATQRGFLES